MSPACSPAFSKNSLAPSPSSWDCSANQSSQWVASWPVIVVTRLAAYRRDGIPYGELEQDEAREVSERLNVPLPWD